MCPCRQGLGGTGQHCQAFPSLLVKFTNLEVAEGHFLTVILQAERCRNFGSESWNHMILAAGDGRGEGFAAEFAFGNFCAVEPVLDVVAIDDDAAFVPFTDGMERLFFSAKKV